MSKIINESAETNPGILGTRVAFEHRAVWFYFLLQEAKKKGNVDWEELRNAIYNCGQYHGEGLLKACKNPNSAAELKAAWLPDACLPLFDMEVVECNDKTLAVDYHYCPLVKAWQKLGCTDEEIVRLCDIAMDGDRGIAGKFGFDFELNSTIAKGDAICAVRFINNK